MEAQPKKLPDQVWDALRLKHYAYRTEVTYIQWIRWYILFHQKRHPREMGVTEIEVFLMCASQKGFNVPVSTLVETAHGSKCFYWRV